MDVEDLIRRTAQDPSDANLTTCRVTGVAVDWGTDGYFIQEFIFDGRRFSGMTGREKFLLEHSDVWMVTHSPSECLRDDACTIHNRSDHSMRSFPQYWRQDRGIIERICPHGVGHPDPDSPWSPDSFQWVHGCDGCCH